MASGIGMNSLGLSLPDSSMTEHPGDIYLKTLSSEKGKKTMKSSISNLIARTTGKTWENFPWELLTRSLVIKMIEVDVKDGDKTPATIRKNLTGLKRIALEASYMEDGISHETYHGIQGIKPVRGGRVKKIMVVPESVIDLMFSRLSERNDFKSLRDAALLASLYFAGLRLHEVVNLKAKDIDIEKGLLWVIGKGNEEARVFFGERCKNIFIKYSAAREKELSALDDTTKTPEAFLLTRLRNGGEYINPIGESAAPRILARISKPYVDAGLLDRAIRPHELRHSCATHLNEALADIKSIQHHLRHKGINTTGIYIQSSEERTSFFASKIASGKLSQETQENEDGK